MELYFRKYYRSLCYFAMNVVHDEHLCEDIVQEVFVRTISLKMQFESELHFRQYIYAAVRNSCLTHMQKHGRTVGLEDVPATGADAPASESCDNEIVRAEIIRMIHEAIDSLPPRYREVFRMAYIDKMKNEDIAEALGISVNTVKVIRQRAKARMRELLKDIYPLLFIFAGQL